MKFPALETVQVVLPVLLTIELVTAFRLTVLHTNDLHSRFDQVTASGAECSQNRECFGGVARIKQKVDSLKQEYPNSVFLNAGDFFQVSKSNYYVCKCP